VHRPDIAELMRTLIGECVAVGRAEGAAMSDDLADEIIGNYRSGSPSAINSLLADRVAGRPLELDARNGAIIRMGKKHGIPTPMNTAVVALINAAVADQQ
jgi:2-dehydropantoate 2-reductase